MKYEELFLHYKNSSWLIIEDLQVDFTKKNKFCLQILWFKELSYVHKNSAKMAIKGLKVDLYGIFKCGIYQFVEFSGVWSLLLLILIVFQKLRELETKIDPE